MHGNATAWVELPESVSTFSSSALPSSSSWIQWLRSQKTSSSHSDNSGSPGEDTNLRRFATASRDNVETCHSLVSLDSLANLMTWLDILALDNFGMDFFGMTNIGIDSFGISVKDNGERPGLLCSKDI